MLLLAPEKESGFLKKQKAVRSKREVRNVLSMTKKKQKNGVSAYRYEILYIAHNYARDDVNRVERWRQR